jgi:hypothetical protein
MDDPGKSATPTGVLVVASPEYRRRAEGTRSRGGPGAQRAARMIRDPHNPDQQARLQPVVLLACSPEDIPSPASAAHYMVNECAMAGAEKLLRALTAY